MCSSTFYTEPLEELLNIYEQHGLIMITGSETLFYHIDIRDSQLLAKITVNLPSNHCRGGQSQARIQRLRDEKIYEYLSNIGEKARELFTVNGLSTIKSLIIAGNGELKSQLIDFISILKNNYNLLTINGITPINDLRPLINDLLIDDTEREIMKEVNYLIETDSNIITYGIEQVNKYLEDFLIQKLIVHKEWEKLYKNNYLTNKLEIHIVNDQKIKDFGGVIAILYYPIIYEQDIE